jgi:hypothetical protein
MHFIEQMFWFSPDGGSGFTELLFLVILLVALSLTTVLVRHRVRARKQSRVFGTHN